MRKFYLMLLGCLFFAAISTFYFGKNNPHPNRAELIVATTDADAEEEEQHGDKDKYDGPDQADSLDAQKMQDPALGYVPYTRLSSAINATWDSKHDAAGNNFISQTLLWQPRGPVYDSVGPSGNSRGGNLYTSGRMAAVLIDTLNDPGGNTAIVGGISGGVWKCTNLLSAAPNWHIVNDYFGNMAISSLCQDPAHPNIVYFSTGEASSNADAHFGAGIWKSTDGGESFTQLPSTITFIRNWKILCDAAGNIYLAARTTGSPALQTSGLLRSSDGGATWTNITPTAQGTATATATCTDIEISSTGKLYASFGYLGTVVREYVTPTPATVTQATGWTLGTGIRVAATSALRLELAAVADTVYGVTINTGYNSDSCYKSIDGGLTFTKQNTTVMPAGLGNGQGWYDLTLSINPSNSNELMSGGLDAYRSTNGGATWVRTTFWVTTIPYVHADHHFMQWWKKGNESRMVIGSDGGLFYSNDGGYSWVDKNRNLSLKQFYCASIHPAAGNPYLLAGAQDNGTHSLKNAGLSYSFEVLGGDGMYCYIDQLDPNIQFGAYVYNQYRRTTNGGQTWTTLNFSGASGLFTNPYDYDDATNTMYACWAGNAMFRWPNANTSTTANLVTVTALNGGQIGGLKVSPYTPNRVFLGGTSGRVLQLDNANATPTITNITGATMPAGYINCVNVGSNDNFLVATFTNYGVNNVWVSSDAGTTWTAVDGNLPDMPVWWAMFDPSNNNKMVLATETGVWTTELLNGTSTVWVANPGFPTTRCSMLRMRTSDNTIVAASYGRGLWTATLPSTPQVNFAAPSTTVTEQSEGVDGCRNYKDYQINVGIVRPPTGDAVVNFTVNAGNTATENLDFDYTTNGSFTAPSKQVTFVSGANGATALKQITVRVYDDAEVESPETFSIGYSVSGTTDAVVGPNNIHTITINDNDRYPAPFTTGSFSSGTFNVDLTSLNTPFDGTKQKHRVQVLYKASELIASGITLSARLNSMNVRVKTKNTTLPFNNFTIAIANTTATNVNTGFIVSLPFQTVYLGNYSTVAGDNIFNFLSPFTWDGSSNVVVQFCFDNTGVTPENKVDIVEGMAAPFGAGTRSSTYSNYTTGANTTPGCALPAAFIDDNRVNAIFGGTFGDPVAVTLNSNRTEYLNANNDLFFYTPSGELMARVLNLNPFNYACTQAVIDRAGSGVSQFWNNNTANYLMNKTFRIIPTNNSATGKYEVTFYFTKAEKDGWEAATGKPWDSIQIIKLPSRINNVTPQNAQPDGPGTIQVIDAVKRTFGPNGYSLSGVFNTGFSAFGFGVAGRMNTILTLTGALNSGNTAADLHWTTSAEINSSVFEIEKSYDGTNFRLTSTKQAAGNKLTPSAYDYSDPVNVRDIYYRIKMLHTDGYILYSNTIHLVNNSAPQRMFVYPNPFVNDLTIRFAVTPSSALTFSIFDASGRLVRKYDKNGGQVQYDLGNINVATHGIYMLRIDADGKRYTYSLMRQ
jgi:hypothetical protein